MAKRNWPFPDEWPVNNWVSFAEEYLSVASVIHSHAPRRTRARMQVSGQAVECALKAFLVASKLIPPASHDLIQLCERAEEASLLVTEIEASAIFQISLDFFQDIGSGVKFKARYPSATTESFRLPVVQHHVVIEAVNSICRQSLARL